ERLPTRQRVALRAAFGMEEAGPADRFLVALATVTLAAECASSNPLLCIVDDAQWVDRESIEALAFWGRRLGGERCALLFAERDSGARDSPLDGFSIMRLDGLGEADARELLASRADADLHPAVVERLVAETAGNPLALLELTQELPVEQLTGKAALPE